MCLPFSGRCSAGKFVSERLEKVWLRPRKQATCLHPAVLLVRKRPQVVAGGGLVVTDCSQKVVFKVEGCGILGNNRELLLRDADGNALLLIRRKGGMIEALSIYRTWKGYKYDFEGCEKLVFGFKEPNSCLARKDVMRISTTGARMSSVKKWEYEIRGYFPDRKCSILDSTENVVAQIGGGGNGEFYKVIIKPEMDQAFVCGLIAILDNIYGESTTC